MQELINIYDYFDKLEYETLFNNLMSISDVNLKEKIRKLINERFETKNNLSFDELRLFGYKKITKPDVFKIIKKILEEVIFTNIRFYFLKDNEKVFLDCLDYDKSFYNFYLSNEKPTIYFDYKDTQYFLKIYDVYFYDIFSKDERFCINLESNANFGFKFKDSLTKLKKQISLALGVKE